MNKRLLLILLCVGCAAALLAAGRWAYVNLKYPIVVAAPANYSFAEFAAKTNRVLGDERPHARLDRISVPTLEDAATVMESGKADLAVIRTDLKLPSNAGTVAIVGRDPAFLIVPHKSGIATFRDLKGKHVAILKTGIDENGLLDKILDFYTTPPQTVTRAVMAPAEIADALKQKKVAAVFVVASPGAKATMDAYAAVAKAGKGPPDIIGIAESEGLAKRLGSVEDGEIAAGAFPGATPRPEESVSTIIVVYRLMANEKTPALIVSELTRLLMQARTRMLSSSPIAQRIQEPDAETDTVPMHPGAKTFYNDGQADLLDRMQNYGYMAFAAVSLLGSAIAWLIAKFKKPEVPTPSVFGARLLEILRGARNGALEDLDELEHRLDDLVEDLVVERSSSQIGAEEAATLAFGVSQVREAIQKRRVALSAAPPTITTLSRAAD
ncbi:MAG: TAXI family TRAP transporter solute-binding subunit [Beijerinckiaceae bacterium]